MISNMHYNILKETIVLQQLAIYYIHRSREKNGQNMHNIYIYIKLKLHIPYLSLHNQQM
jgi:hypothetical protein